MISSAMLNRSDFFSSKWFHSFFLLQLSPPISPSLLSSSLPNLPLFSFNLMAMAIVYTPNLNKQKKRQRAKRVRRPLSKEERSKISKEGKRKAKALQAEIEEEWERQDIAADALATKYGKNVSWMRSRLQRTSYLKNTRRAINKWNAVVHIKSLEIDESGVCY